MGPRNVLVTASPRRHLRGAATRLVGYDLRGQPAGVHRGLPSTSITVVLSLDQPLRVGDVATPRRLPALVGGLHTEPVPIPHDGDQYGIQVSIDPLASRPLLGMPAAALHGQTVALTDVLGERVRLAHDRVATAPDWRSAFRAVHHHLFHDLDHSHLVRDWQQFAGCSPTEWLDDEVLPFVQDRADPDDHHGSS